jgi:hopene-associated glycosyltransferase HpnB
MTVIDLIAMAALAIWVCMLLGRGGFWLSRDRDDWTVDLQPNPPPVVAVIPARNEEDVIGVTVRALLEQDFPALSIIVVDDNSTDGTAAIVQRLGAEGAGRVSVIRGAPLPAGWTGKLWAVKQGVDMAQERLRRQGYVLLIDADIACAPDTVSRLVAHAEANNLVLTSLMAKLRCESLAERMTIPAFIFFFQMLYPFAWVNRRDRGTAAAAGGCMLVRSNALQTAGGIEAIRNALIDDCALARRMKAVGPIWLALTDRVHSLRPYPEMGDVRKMVARSAYTQLRYSPLLLAGTILGMALTYLAPPLLALFAGGPTWLLGAATWAMMTVAFLPTVSFYRLSPLWAVALPFIALLYMLFTLDSAIQHARGRGGMWKGRAQSHPSGS